MNLKEEKIKFKNETKREKGITLIALIVAIIVILILAGITISMLTGNNGILNRAGNAKDLSDIAQITDLVRTAEGGARIKGLGDVYYSDLDEEMTKMFGAENYTIEPQEDAVEYDVTVRENLFKISGVTSKALPGSTQINWEEIQAIATKHPEQSEGNKDIGIDANGNVCNLDFWMYDTLDDCYGIEHGAMLGSDSQDVVQCYSPAEGWEEATEAVLPQYIKFYDERENKYEDFFRPVLWLSGDSFECYKQLRTVVFPSTLRGVGGNVFGGCSSLYTLTIPEQIEKWGESTDNECGEPGLPGALLIDSEPCCEKAYSGFALEDPGCLQKICIKSDYYNSEKDVIVWWSDYLYDHVRFEYTTTSKGYAVYERVIEKERSPEIAEGVTTRATYGKYVNYNIDLGIGSENDATDDWKVFYDDGTNIFIIAADTVPLSKLSDLYSDYDKDANTKKTIKEALGITNNYGNIEWDSGSDFQKAGAADIFTNRSAGTAFLEEKGLLGIWKAQTTTSNNDNAKMTASLMDTKIWQGLAEGTLPAGVSGTSYAIGGPTLSMWVESWNKTRKTQIYYDRASSTGYNVKAETRPYEYDTVVYLRSKDDFKDLIHYTYGNDYYSGDLYFPHSKEYVGAYECNGYWLASPSDAGSDDEMVVDFTGKVSYDSCVGRRGTYGYAIRPVVCLPSGIGLKTNSSNEDLYDITNNEWDN